MWEPGARGVFSFLRKHAHWGHYVAVLAIGISLSSVVIHKAWLMAGLVLLVFVPVLGYGFIRLRRAYLADRAP